MRGLEVSTKDQRGSKGSRRILMDLYNVEASLMDLECSKGILRSFEGSFSVRGVLRGSLG